MASTSLTTTGGSAAIRSAPAAGARQVIPVGVTATITKTPSGSRLRTVVRVVNHSSSSAPRSRLFLSRLDPEYTQQLVRVPVPALAPGERMTIEREISVPTSSQPGRFRVEACPTRHSGGRLCQVTRQHLWLASAHVRVSTSALDFGEVPLGQSRERSIVLTNTGQLTARQPIVLPQARDPEGRDFDQFAAPSPACADLAPSESCTVTVTYTPTRTGAVQAELLVGHGSATFIKRSEKWVALVASGVENSSVP